MAGLVTSCAQALFSPKKKTAADRIRYPAPVKYLPGRLAADIAAPPSISVIQVDPNPTSCPVSKADQRVQVAGAASPAPPDLSSLEEMFGFREEAVVASVDLDYKCEARWPV